MTKMQRLQFKVLNKTVYFVLRLRKSQHKSIRRVFAMTIINRKKKAGNKRLMTTCTVRFAKKRERATCSLWCFPTGGVSNPFQLVPGPVDDALVFGFSPRNSSLLFFPPPPLLLPFLPRDSRC